MCRTPLSTLLILFFVSCGLSCFLNNPLAGNSCSISNPLAIRANVSPGVTSPLIINEYMADPPAIGGDANGDGAVSSSQDEFIEVVNSGPEPLDAAGYSIVVGTATRFTFPAGTMIPAGEAALIFGGGSPSGAFGNARALGLVFTASLALVNGGTTITIKDNSGVTADELTYGSSEGNADQSLTRSPDITGAFIRHSLAAGAGGRPFSPGTRVDGSTFTTPVPLISSISPDAAVSGTGAVHITIAGTNFEPTSQVLVDGSAVATAFVGSTELSAEIPASFIDVAGTHLVTVQNPGPVNSNALSFVVLAPAGINELLADPPDGPEGDANGDGIRSTAGDEFIEIVNRTASPFDVSGYSLSDADQKRFIFPEGSIIPAGDVAVVFGGGQPQGEFGNAAFNGLVFTASLSLNNSSETITLRDRSNAVVEVVRYGAEGGQNESLNRSPEISGTVFVRHSSIPGAGARRFSPGTKADGSPFTIGPRITSISPERVPQDTAAFDITIEGENFDADSVVLIDSVAAVTRFERSTALFAVVSTRVTSISGTHRVTVRNPDGNRSNPKELVVVPPPPILSSVVPRIVELGSPALTLFALGKGFDPGATGLVDDSPVPTGVSSRNELRLSVPSSFASTLGQRRIRIRNGDGQESGVNFVEIVRPFVKVTSVSPSVVAVGETEVTLSIAGENFVEGLVAYLDRTLLPTTVISATQLKAIVAAELLATPGLRGVSVQNVDGFVSNEVIFRVRPDPPIIREIDPAAVREGSADVKLTISGQKFQTGAVVQIGDGANPAARLAAVFVSGSQLETLLPASFLSRPGRIAVRVENPDFGLSNEMAVNVLMKDPLVINEYLADPPEGSSGDANGDGSRSSSQDEFVEILNRTSDTIDISGYRISDSDAVRHVFAAGTLVPPGEAVVVFGGGSPRGEFGNAGDNNLVFKASGGGLSLNNGGDTIRLEDDEGQLLQEIIFTATEGNAGQSLNRDPDGDGAQFSLHSRLANGSGRLFSPGTRTTGDGFTIKPVIDSVEPGGVRQGSPGFTLSITGSDFLAGAVILFGDAELPTTLQSSSLLEAHVDESLVANAGAVEVRVRNPKGELSLSRMFLIVGEPPRITGLSPDNAGTGSPAIEVLIEGSNFQRRAVAVVNGEPVQTKVRSDHSLAFELEEKFLSAAAQLAVRIKNEDGNQSNELPFTVENGPLITRLSRSRIKAGRGEVRITVGGVSFSQGVTLFVNDMPVGTRFVNEAELVAVIPAELTATPGKLTLQARNPNGGRSNPVTLRVVER